MKRRFLIPLLGFGTFLGFASGFASMGADYHQRHEARRAAFEAHVADVCVDAARRGERTDRADHDEPPSDHADQRRARHAGPDLDW